MATHDLSEDDVGWSALLLVDLMLRPKDWIHRRIEKVSFDDDRAATREVVVDFSVPLPSEHVRRAMPDSVKTVFVPLSLMRKGRGRLIDLVDESHQACPMVTRQGRIAVAEQTLSLLAIGAAGPLEDEVSVGLETIARANVPDAYYELRRFVIDGTAPNRILAKATPAARQRAELFRDVPFRIVLFQLTWSFALLVGVSNTPGERRVMSFSYTDRPASKPSRDTHVQRRVAGEQRSSLTQRVRWRTRQSRRVIGRALGWSPRVFSFPCAALTYGRSYHFHITGPQGTQISTSALYVTRTWSPRRNPYKRSSDDAMRSLRREAEASDWEAGSLHYSHLYLSPTPDTGVGVAEVELRPDRGTFVQGILLTAILALGLLAAGLRFLPDLTDPDVGTALLLLLPTVLMAYVVQPSAPHALAARLLSAVRAFGILVGLSLLVAAGSLVIAQDKHPPDRIAWEAALYVTAGAVVILFGAWMQARPRRYKSSGERK